MPPRPAKNWLCTVLVTLVAAWSVPSQAERPFLKGELLFPPETWHNHGSSIVELPGGDLLACWFHESGERTADDVIIEGARLRKGSRKWSERFTLSDTPGFPDGNPCMFVDPQERLWLFHTIIVANTWESALLQARVSTDYRKGAPKWDSSQTILMKPGPEFATEIGKRLPELQKGISSMRLNASQAREAEHFLSAMRENATNKLYARMGWMTRAHPLVVGNRLILPLYHDGYSFSLMGISDDWGTTWRCSTPLVGAGNIQPSIVPRNDGTLYTLMRDNGPPPQRLLQSHSSDRGLTWAPVTDSDIPNPGSGAEIIRLRNGRWVLANNDQEEGRHTLAVWMSDDEGRSWKWKRRLEDDPPGRESGRYHYPSIIQAADGTLHATYSHHLHGAQLPKDVDGDPAGKSIKHVHFNEAWVMEGETSGHAGEARTNARAAGKETRKH